MAAPPPRPLPRRCLAGAAVALLASGLVAVGSAAWAPAAAAAAAADRPTAVVSLGDSAISGEGAGAYEPGTDGPRDYCHRSANSLIQATAIPGVRARVNLACSGAASSDIRIGGTSHARWGRTEAVGGLSAALRGVAERTGARFLDLARATEGREACNRSVPRSSWWITPLIVDAHELFESGDPIHVVQQSFHPDARGHAQMGRCLTEFYAAGGREGACVRGSDDNLHAVPGMTAATAHGFG